MQRVKTMLGNNTKVERLKAELLKEIRNGVYAPGGALPSVLSLAKKYDVSKVTVSQVLSILDELEIIEVAHGKSTRVRKTAGNRILHVIYVGTGESGQNSFWGDVFSGISDAVKTSPQYTLDQTLGSGGWWTKSNLRRVFNPAQSSGIFVFGTSDKKFLSLLMSFGVPVLSVCSFTEELNLPYVAADFSPAIRSLVEKLRAKDCRRVALLSSLPEIPQEGSRNSGLNYEKFHGTKQALLGAGLMPGEEYAAFASPLPDIHCGYRFFQDLFHRQMRPDALVVCRDRAALGIYRAAFEYGLKIPEDCAIIGFDDLEEDPYLVPSLSSISLHRRELGYCAGRMMLDFLDRGIPLKSRRLPAELIVRESL